ncbi:ceramidase domain-containing protein [Oceanomicrobium pacificus]|uniref:Ceramidase n=1 Tax=Oceanomicrobium pacificus TaxID=2692916 RepID=A0A6B0TLK1_9RHOB|nr:ceramidase domain-containing protein [Oceanomicrobium pacificus]MXU65410.1 hypothetical protein [Oceanomicrobium pacificus]
MNWLEQIDSYCERTDPTFWSEPVNAVTNLAFLIAAYWIWRRHRQDFDTGEAILMGWLVMIGIGSFLFHTVAQAWAAALDTLPILGFVLTYIYLATVRFLRFPPWAGVVAVIGFFPYAAGFATLLMLGWGPMNGSVSYIPVAVLIAVYGLVLLWREPATGVRLLTGAAILALSLFFRSIDEAVCAALPLGTHFLWHLLNGLMLGWMIRAMVLGPRPRASLPAA